MACFIVPVVEAIAVTAAARVVQSKEKEAPALGADSAKVQKKLPFSRKLKWLSNLLWGGAALLAFEHLWHGEVVPWFPFLSALSSPADASVMLHEMATVGVGMALLVTAVWGVMLLVANAMAKKAPVPETAETRGNPV